MTTTDLEPVTTTGLFHTDQPRGIIAQATDIAGELATVIRQQRLAVGISGREHVKVEGWTLLGTLLGVHPETVWSRQLFDTDGNWVGYEARVEARTLDGRLVGAAESECTTEERTWKTRDRYALRSMAQTRATSKALRQPLGFVMALAGFDPTPADEMPANQPGPRQRIVVGPEVDTLEHDPTFDEPASRDDQTATQAQQDKINDLLEQLETAKPDVYNPDTIRMQLKLEYRVTDVAKLTRKQARELQKRLERKADQLL